MPYSIETRDGIIIDNIPDDIAPDSQVLKDRVAQERAKLSVETPVPEEQLVAPQTGADTPGDVSFGTGLAEGFGRGVRQFIGGASQRGLEGLTSLLDSQLKGLEQDLAEDKIPDNELIETLQRMDNMEQRLIKMKGTLARGEECL